MRTNKLLALALTALTATVLVGCTSVPTSAELDRQALAAIRSSFRDEGIAKVDRLTQDLAQQACSAPTPPSAELAKQIESSSLAGVKWPADGRYLGDWREGEKLAQNGRGMTWTDPSAEPKDNGANCYNCHQIDKKEISFGTIGPSLWNYGKQRGVRDVSDATAAPVLQYTWAKIYNSKAYAACSNMPRFGHMGLLSEQQMRDVMALLLDPKSPVNQ
jgi:L-cysteine S-thiosulfotransferase